MNSYLNELSRLLANSISPEEFNNVMQYYTEYFADAGIEKQEEVIKELGTPEELANKIIEEYNGRQEDESCKQENLSAKEIVIEEPKNINSQASAPTPPRPRRRLAAGWIVLIVIGGILISLPIIIASIRKTTDKIGKVFSDITIVEQEYKVLDEFDSIILDVSVCNIDIIKGEEYAVEYALGEDMSMNLNGNALIIKDNSYVSILSSDFKNIADTYIKIYVPEDEVIDMEISVDVGNVNINNVEFDSVNIEADTGDVTIEADSDGGNVYISADIGDITIKGFLGCDVEVEADIGKVNITSYYASSSYNCNVDSELGKETISDEGGKEIDAEYDIDVTADIGKVKIVFCDNWQNLLGIIDLD